MRQDLFRSANMLARRRRRRSDFLTTIFVVILPIMEPVSFEVVKPDNWMPYLAFLFATNRNQSATSFKSPYWAL